MNATFPPVTNPFHETILISLDVSIAKSEHQNSEQSCALEYKFPGRKLKKVGLIHWTPSRNVILKSAAALRLFTMELVLILNN